MPRRYDAAGISCYDFAADIAAAAAIDAAS